MATLPQKILFGKQNNESLGCVIGLCYRAHNKLFLFSLFPEFFNTLYETFSDGVFDLCNINFVGCEKNTVHQ